MVVGEAACSGVRARAGVYVCVHFLICIFSICARYISSSTSFIINAECCIELPECIAYVTCELSII